MPRPIVAEIDVAALAGNYRLLERAAAPARVLAVVKANAYGHGTGIVARALNPLVAGYGVVDFDDAREVRETGFAGPILMLNGMFDPADGECAIAHDLWLVVHERWQLDWVTRLRPSAIPRIFIKVETGMNRLGFTVDEARRLLPGLLLGVGRERLALMTHFARADEADGVDEPVRRIGELADDTGLPLSLSNSAGVLFHGGNTRERWARCGIALYGASPNPLTREAGAIGLCPVMTLKSTLIGVRPVRKGDRVGYGRAFSAPRDMVVGHVACGYGDGYPWAAGPAGAPVSVKGRPAHVVGRVSMDMLAVDLEGVPDPAVGDEVVLLGKGPPADTVAGFVGGIGYDVLSGVSRAVRRVAVNVPDTDGPGKAAPGPG